MDDSNSVQADIARVAKLKQLASAGKIEGPSSYFNHLIEMYGEASRLNAHRTLTDRERKRVDLFLESFTSSDAELRQLTESGE